MRTATALLALALAITGCATIDRAAPPPEPEADEHGTVDNGFPEGARTPPPWGYTDHCRREPESVFCP